MFDWYAGNGKIRKIQTKNEYYLKDDRLGWCTSRRNFNVGTLVIIMKL